MKGGIELGTFIKQVKKELMEAQDDGGTPFYSLDSVALEASFVLDSTGKSKGNLFVVELEGEVKASQTHKVTLTLTPLSPRIENSQEVAVGIYSNRNYVTRLMRKINLYNSRKLCHWMQVSQPCSGNCNVQTSEWG